MKSLTQSVSDLQFLSQGVLLNQKGDVRSTGRYRVNRLIIHGQDSACRCLFVHEFVYEGVYNQRA